MAQILPIRFQEHLQVGYGDALEKYVPGRLFQTNVWLVTLRCIRCMNADGSVANSLAENGMTPWQRKGG